MTMRFPATALKFLLLGILGGAHIFAQAIPDNLTFQNFFPGVSFQRPVYFAEVPGKDSNYVVLEQQNGLAGIVHRRNAAWVKDTLLKITVVSTQNEMGLLGIAFHPKFLTNHKYYIFYSQSFTSGNGVNVIEERQTDSTLIKDAGVAPRQILRITKAAMNHNGGEIIFGKDGYFYVGIGDGGDPQGDPPARAQNPDTLLGKFLRIDVDNPSNGKPYGIPSDNPFVANTAYRPEIWALGVRNPWRWSFDDSTGKIWAGDVGNGTWEEVTNVAKGQNLGWAIMEGFVCQPPAQTCNKTGLTLPIFAYDHSNGNNAIIGGHVFRANPASPFYGVYFFGDNGSGQVRAIRVVNNVKTDSVLFSSSLPGLSAIGQDSHGSLYATSMSTNQVFRFVSTNLQPVPVPIWQPARQSPRVGWKPLERENWYNLHGSHVERPSSGRGIYITRGRDGSPALVPILK